MLCTRVVLVFSYLFPPSLNFGRPYVSRNLVVFSIFQFTKESNEFQRIIRKCFENLDPKKWPVTFCVDQAGLEIRDPLPMPPESWRESIPMLLFVSIMAAVVLTALR